MEEPLDQEQSLTNDDIKPSSSTTKSSRLTKQTTSTNGSTRRHKRRRQTNSTRSSSDHSTSSSRSSSSSNHSSHSSSKNFPSNDLEPKKTRSCLAQEQLQLIVEKTQTGKYDTLDGFAFLSFETDDDWRIAFEHFKQQQQIQQAYTRKKSFVLSGKKNGNGSEYLDEHSFHRSISVPCKTEDGHRLANNPTSISIDDTSIENHRSSMWPNISPSKTSNDRQSLTTIKSEPMEKTSRTTSEHDENHFDSEHLHNSTASSQKSTDDIKNESSEKKHHHHHHHHHHHKSHKRHKTKHDLTANGDSANKHATITSMSDLAKQHIKHEPIPLPPPFNFPPHFDPKLFPLPSFTPFAPHHLPPSTSFPGSYDHSLMLANRLYGNQYPRDLPMPPPPRPPSRSLPHPFSLKENHPDSSTSMEKMLERYYPGVLPSYLAAAAAAASSNNNSPGSSLNVKMNGASPNGPDHPLWPHRETLQRQFLSASNKQSSTKSPLFDSNIKSSSHHSGPSPTDHHHHHHHRRHDSSTSNTDLPNSTTPTGHPLYLAPVIVTEFHQHQHNHNHTHEHKLNITTKDDRQSSPRSKTPLSNETKKPKSSFSVTDMFIDKTSPVIKHSPQPQGFLSVINSKKDNNQSSLVSLKKPSNGKWSTAHVHIAWMIYHHEQRQREKLNLLTPTSKVRPSPTLLPSSTQSTFLPPPLQLTDNNNDLSLLRPPPAPFPFPFDITSQQNHLFRPPPPTAKLPRPTVTSSSSSSSSSIKTPTIKREQKTPFIDERIRRTSPSPLSRPTSASNFPPSSPSHRMRMDFPSLLLPPPSQHQLPSFSFNDDRKRMMGPNPDFLQPFASSVPQSPFLSSLFPMGAPPISPQIHSSSSSSSRRSGINSDSQKSSLFPPPMPPSFDFTRSPLLSSGHQLPTNHLESDRYRFLLEQQARERDLQFAMMAAAATGNGPPFFPDPTSALFKHH